jgi:hypothetical protein
MSHNDYQESISDESEVLHSECSSDNNSSDSLINNTVLNNIQK